MITRAAARLAQILALTLTLALAALASLPQPARADPPAQLIGSLTLTHPGKWFGGFSGLAMAPDGGSALLITDRGRWARVRLERQADGRLIGAQGWKSARLLGTDGAALPRERTDSEGLALLPDGRICISFENIARVECRDRIDGVPTIVPGVREFEGMPVNGSLEALAVDEQGALYTIPENAPARDGRIPVYRRQDDSWSVAFHLPAQGGFRPVGADILEGQLYVLLRSFGPLGFQSRLMRLPLAGGVVERLMQTGPGVHDNLEGLSVWRDGDGALVASMIADDNQNWFQRSEIVEYRVPEPGRVEGALPPSFCEGLPRGT